MNRGRAGRYGADFDQSRPELAQRPYLGHRQELVLVDADGKADVRRGIDKRLARILEEPEVSGGGCQHRAEFLGLGRAGVVVDAPVGLEQDAGHAEREEMRQRLRHRRLQRFDGHR